MELQPFNSFENSVGLSNFRASLTQVVAQVKKNRIPRLLPLAPSADTPQIIKGEWTTYGAPGFVRHDSVVVDGEEIGLIQYTKPFEDTPDTYADVITIHTAQGTLQGVCISWLVSLLEPTHDVECVCGYGKKDHWEGVIGGYVSASGSTTGLRDDIRPGWCDEFMLWGDDTEVGT